MLTHRTEAIVSEGHVLTIRGVPFRPGEKVEVIILSHPQRRGGKKRYPLRGKPIHYIRPFDSVAENDWQVLQ
ncbi:MAG: hypothetical protein ACPLRM_08520 [Anaerolineae bacterium]